MVLFALNRLLSMGVGVHLLRHNRKII